MNEGQFTPEAGTKNVSFEEKDRHLLHTLNMYGLVHPHGLGVGDKDEPPILDHFDDLVNLVQV